MSWSTFSASAASTVSLVETLRPGDDGDQRPRGARERPAERVELGRHQRPGAGDGRVLGDAVRGGLGAVRGAERVVDVDVAQRGHRFARARRRSSSRPC